MVKPHKILSHWRAWLVAGLIGFTGSAAVNIADAASLLANGGFETGDFTGWSVATQGVGNWFVATGTQSPLNTSLPVAGAAEGLYFAITDQTRPGSYALTQAFTVPANAGFVQLSFQMFVDNFGAAGFGSSTAPYPLTFNNTALPNQHARVDLLTASASAFDTAASSIVANFYLGSDAGGNPHPYGYYQFNVTALVTPGSTYQIRFADVAGQTILHQGVDAVSIIAEIPEPDSSILFTAGLGLLLGLRLRRGNRHGSDQSA
jgi:hypothetical protein